MKNFLVYVKINGIMTNRIVVAESAELPEKENRYEMILRRIMDSLDKEDAVVITKDMLALKAKIEMLNGKSIEDIVNALLDGMMEDDE